MSEMQHSFLLVPGNWEGQGKIVLSMVGEELVFNTTWNVQPRDFSGKVDCLQAIQVQGISESMRNALQFGSFQNNTFSVDMENVNVGRITGKGVYDDKMIGWEFRNNEANFEGFETYHIQPDGSYLMRGEYITTDQFRTQIEARIWPTDKEIPPFNENEGEEPNEDGGETE